MPHTRARTHARIHAHARPGTRAHTRTRTRTHTRTHAHAHRKQVFEGPSESDPVRARAPGAAAAAAAGTPGNRRQTAPSSVSATQINAHTLRRGTGPASPSSGPGPLGPGLLLRSAAPRANLRPRFDGSRVRTVFSSADPARPGRRAEPRRRAWNPGRNPRLKARGRVARWQPGSESDGPKATVPCQWPPRARATARQSFGR